MGRTARMLCSIHRISALRRRGLTGLDLKERVPVLIVPTSLNRLDISMNKIPTLEV